MHLPRLGCRWQAPLWDPLNSRRNFLCTNSGDWLCADPEDSLRPRCQNQCHCIPDLAKKKEEKERLWPWSDLLPVAISLTIWIKNHCLQERNSILETPQISVNAWTDRSSQISTIYHCCIRILLTWTRKSDDRLYNSLLDSLNSFAVAYVLNSSGVLLQIEIPKRSPFGTALGSPGQYVVP